MNKLDDLFKILGVKKTATKEQIKRAYRKKSKKLHPDKGGSQDEFTKLSQAYDILMDDFKRAKYESGYNPDGDIEKEAKAYLFDDFNTAIRDKIRNKSQILKQMNSKITAGIQKYEAEVTLAKNKMKDYEKVRGLVTIEHDKENLYEEVINQNINTLTQEIALKESIQILKKVYDILKDYKEKKEDPTYSYDTLGIQGLTSDRNWLNSICTSAS